ncbi:MAG: multidrug efflux RND transporter permease subunit, partial [Candidatus Eremiobacteraeota bacterium]|nr:multidrug efflux RND transporter permease subunit [Candidatus Eremiobacteraeota bacterium]
MSAKTFIHRPVLSIVIAILITMVGALALPNMAVQRFPDLVPPTVLVSANYPGASAVTVEQTVASQIEQEVNGAEHMIYMSSKSSSDGSYQLTCSFEVGTDVDLAAVDVQNRVNRATSTLPEEVTRNGITVAKQSTQFLMVATLYSPKGTYDKLFLSNYASINLLDPLSRVPGVGGVEVRFGGADYAMRMWVKPDVLARLGVTTGDITGALREQNVQASAGSIGQPPQPSGLAFQYPVTVEGQLNTVDQFNNVVVKVDDDGNIVRIRDVARTELGSETYDSFGRRNGQEAIPMIVFQRPGANALEVATKARAELERLKKNFPEDVEVDVTYDATHVVEASIHEVLKTLTEAFLLVVVVVFTFLGNFRATLIPLLAVPVSLIGTFAILFAFGFSINTLTLLAMVLAIGIVVDDAIVVVEAVEHHIEEGMTPLAATEQAMSEVAGPVVAIALVLCSVFVPVAFLGGLAGQLYRQFAITMSAAVLLSALVALTLTPALCQMILRPRQKMWGPFGWYIALFEGFFNRVVSGYRYVVAVAVRRLVLVTGLMAVVFFSVWGLNKTLPTGLVPAEDNGYLLISIALPPGSALERTDAIASRVEKIVMDTPGVRSMVMMGGTNLLTGSRGPNYASSFIIFEPWDERSEKESAEAIQGHLMAEFSKIQEANVMAINPPPIPGLGRSGGFVFELQDRSGGTPDELEAATQSFLGAARQDPRLVGLFTPFSTAVPEIALDVDRAKVKVLGVKLDEVFSTLQVNLGGAFVNLFNKFGRTWRVYVQSEAEYRRNPDDIGNLYVRGRDDQMIPLSTLTHARMTTAPDLLQRYNLYRTAEIYGSARPGLSSAEGLAAMEELAQKHLPAGYGFEWTGTAYQEKISSGQQTQILLLALVFVFLFLAALYESWAVPLSILIGLPLGILGAYLGLLAAGYTNNVYAQIGIITLMGLAAKNAILIVEFAKNQYEQGGKSLAEAALEGARLRFRPILMTSFAFILGVMPLALANGARGRGGHHVVGVALARLAELDHADADHICF